MSISNKLRSTKKENVISHNIWNGYDSEVQCRFSVNALQIPDNMEIVILQVICDTGYPEGNTTSELRAEFDKQKFMELLESETIVDYVRNLYRAAELENAKYFHDTIH